jgi:cell division protein FtsA
MGELVVGIDIGTTKVCTIVGEVRHDDTYIVGLGIEPTQGMKKGMVTDVAALTASISSSVHKAERSSGYEIGRAFVSVSAKHVQSMNNKGMTALNANQPVEMNDLMLAMEAARALALPQGREILHVVPRRYHLDDHQGVRNPIGMHGYRLEVEAHVITAASISLENLEKCVEGAGVLIDRFILNPLASGDVVLTNTERESGVMVLDIGGGTTDIAIFIEGTVWHTGVIPLGGQNISNDVAQVMNLPPELAEAVKLEFGHADPRAVQPLETFRVQPFGEEHVSEVKRADLVDIINARVLELFELVQVEVKRSGYEGLLPAGVVLTGGASLLPGMKAIANRVLQLPARVAQPEAISGMADPLRNPAYSTSVGLLRLGLIMDMEDDRRDKFRKTKPRRRLSKSGGLGGGVSKAIGGIFKRFIPNLDDEG